jgi:NAD(P)H-dependent FMN reductase
MLIEIVSMSAAKESRSRALAAEVRRRFADSGAEAEWLDVRELSPVRCDGRPLENYPALYGAWARRLHAADAVVLAVPVHLYNPSGTAMNVLAIIGDVLEGKPVGILSAAGTTRSHLAMLPLVSALIFEWGCHVVPNSVQHCGRTTLRTLGRRIDGFVREMLAIAGALAAIRRDTEAA